MTKLEQLTIRQRIPALAAARDAWPDADDRTLAWQAHEIPERFQDLMSHRLPERLWHRYHQKMKYRAGGNAGAPLLNRKALTISERSQAHAAQARADLERAVAALRDSDAWRCNLTVMAQFHHYSEPVS